MTMTATRHHLFTSVSAADAYAELERLDREYLRVHKRKANAALFLGNLSDGIKTRFTVTVYAEPAHAAEASWFKSNASPSNA